MNAKTFAVPTTVLIGALVLAGCSADPGSNPPTATTSATDHGSTDHGSMDHGSAAGTTPSSASASGTAANDADVMFAQMMIPHHEQAVRMSDIVQGKQGLDPRVRQLATRIKAAQAPEIETLRAWLSDWGRPSAMPSGSGHSMDGMMGADDMAELEAADGTAASRLFLTQMIAHHEGAVSMAETEAAGGRNAEAVAMAASVVASQGKEIEEMKALLKHM